MNAVKPPKTAAVTTIAISPRSHEYKAKNLQNEGQYGLANGMANMKNFALRTHNRYGKS